MCIFENTVFETKNHFCYSYENPGFVIVMKTQVLLWLWKPKFCYSYENPGFVIVMKNKVSLWLSKVAFWFRNQYFRNTTFHHVVNAEKQETWKEQTSFPSKRLFCWTPSFWFKCTMIFWSTRSCVILWFESVQFNFLISRIPLWKVLIFSFAGLWF